MIDLFRQLKLEYKDYLILFKSGSFYIAFDEDATILHNLFNYKFVELKNNVKSGFPVNMLEGNLKVIDENKINYIIIENKRIIDKKIYKPNRFYKYISSVYDIINFSNRVDDIFKKITSIENKELKEKILDELAASDVQRLMGHSILSTTFIYTHSNRDINKSAVSIFDKIYEKNNEMIVNFNQMLSLYTGMNFACSSEIIKLINFAVKIDVEKSEKCKMIRDYIDKKYPIFKTIDISNISINNVWDMLDMYRKRYGDKFLLQNIQ